MKRKIVSIAIASFMLLSGTAFAYDDIDNHWAKDYINNTKAEGVLGQFYENSLYPDKQITRGESAELIADFLENYYGYEPKYSETNNKYSDLKAGTQTSKIRALSRIFYRSILTSNIDEHNNFAKANIIDGYPDGTFKPNEKVTRAEFSKMLINALDAFGYVPLANYEQFEIEDENHWAKKYINIAIGINAVDGYSNYYNPESGLLNVLFKPENNITRAEAIKMVSSTSKKANPTKNTRAVDFPFFYSYEEMPDSNENRIIKDSRFGYEVEIPKDWIPLFPDFGSGFRVIKNFNFSVYAHFEIDDTFQYSYDELVNEGYSIQEIHLENTTLAYKGTKEDSVKIIAVRRNSNSNNQFGVTLSNIDKNDLDYAKAIKTLESFRIHERGYE